MSRWSLVASVALNVFLLGFIIGDFARPLRTAQGLAELGSHYPDEVRRAIRAEMIAGRRDFRASIEEFNAVRAELFEAMRAPEFDRAKAEALMAEVRAKTIALQAQLQRATLAAVSAAPAEVRAKIDTPQLGDRMGFADN